jgi:hypothetical protein
MSKTEASTQTRPTTRSLEEIAPYWAVNGEPSGIQKLMELNLHGAWRVALTLPDLLQQGWGDDVAIVLIHSVELVLKSRHSSELHMALKLACNAHENQVTAGRSPIDLKPVIEAIFESSPSDAAALGGYLLTLVDEAFSNDHHGKGRSSFFDSFAFFAYDVAQLSDDPVALFDQLLALIAERFGEGKQVFVDGYELAEQAVAGTRPAPKPTRPVSAAERKAKVLPIRDRRAGERRRSTRPSARPKAQAAEVLSA